MIRRLLFLLLRAGVSGSGLLQLLQSLQDDLPLVLAPVVPAGAHQLVVVVADEGGDVVLGLGAQGVNGGGRAVEQAGDDVLLVGALGGLQGADLTHQPLAAVIHIHVQDGHEVRVDELEGGNVGSRALSTPGRSGEDGGTDKAGSEETDGGTGRGQEGATAQGEGAAAQGGEGGGTDARQGDGVGDAVGQVKDGQRGGQESEAQEEDLHFVGCAGRRN